MTSDRARDRLGRPLPAGADPALIVAGIDPLDGTSDERAWHSALRYLDRGMPFHAHEVFEERWRRAPALERDTWRALAQWGAALTHEARGNARGARLLADRAIATLAQAEAVPSVVDTERMQESCERLRNRSD